MMSDETMLSSIPAAGYDAAYIFLVTAIFFVNHLFSFLYNREKDEKKQNLGRIMFAPYVRIIPLHFTFLGAFLIFGGEKQAPLILFLVLKTVADVIMHIREHAEVKAGA